MSNSGCEFNGRIIILGSGEEALEEVFTKAMARNSNLLFLKGYGQGVGDLMYQLGDLFLMPSSFEPCGISQMLAMRAGQPCLVHSVGGLKDTVKHNENGFSFNAGTLSKQADSLLKCLHETLTLHKEQPKQWQKLKLMLRHVFRGLKWQLIIFHTYINKVNVNTTFSSVT
ncbi:glycosyltransferase (plasmid) [Pseudoalteromonas espejiana]